MNIFGKKVILRSIEKRDVSLITKMFNDPEIEHLVEGWAFPLSDFAELHWLENNYHSQNLRLIIQVKDTDESIGIATLSDIDWKNRHAFHGMKIADKKCRGGGYGTDALMAIMRYAFDELGMVRLDGSWLESNIVSQNMYKKNGWEIEGCRRKYVYKNGRFYDLCVGGILEENYRRLIEKNDYWNYIWK